jgi:hypothetical protein
VRGAVVALVLAFSILALEVRAEGALPLELEWDAPPGCASAGEIRSELDRIARVRPGRTVSRLAARGRIEKVGSSYRLTLHTEQNGVAGERTLDASECRTLEREVTFVLAVAFGEGVELVRGEQGAPAAGVSTQAPADEGRAVQPSADVIPKPSPPPATVDASEPDHATPVPRKRLRAAVLVGGGALFGTLPSPSGFVMAGATFGGLRLWLDARVLWIPRVEQVLTHGVRARYQGFGGALSGCASVPYASAFSACVAVEAAALGGRASGATENVQSIAPFFSVAPVVAWQWPSRSALRLRLEAALHIAMSQPQFLVVGLGEAHRVPLLSPSLGAVVAFSPGR